MVPPILPESNSMLLTYICWINHSIFNPETWVKYIYQDERGIISIEQIISDIGKNDSFFISGPPVMIKIFKDNIIKMGISLFQIKTDEWE